MRITVNVPDDVGEEAENVAQTEGVSMSSLVAQAVRRYLEERRRAQAVERINALIGTAPAGSQAVEEIRRERRAADRSTD
jgi:metal-responsive CopG/Arc/MetJ family transcriptional regulator